MLLLAGCASLLGPTVVRWTSPGSPRAVSVVPRRDDCLKPPYTVPSGQTVTLHGLRAEARGDGPRELTLSTPPGAPLEADAMFELLGRNEAALRAIDGVEHVGLSGCHGAGGRPMPCLSISLQLCAEPLDALAESLAGILARDAQVRGHQVIFHVALLGAVAPRCEAAAPACRPEPYASARYEPGARRGLLRELPQGAEPDCNGDGECAKSSCGGDCVSWTAAHQPGSCTADPALQGAFCGCVDHRCAWFVQ